LRSSRAGVEPWVRRAGMRRRARKRYVLDTDAVSALMKGEPRGFERWGAAKSQCRSPSPPRSHTVSSGCPSRSDAKHCRRDLIYFGLVPGHQPHGPDTSADRRPVRPPLHDRRDVSRPEGHSLRDGAVQHAHQRSGSSRSPLDVGCVRSRGYSLCLAPPAKQADSTAYSRRIRSRNVHTPSFGKAAIGISRYQTCEKTDSAP
jgi:hypothetical protein